MLLDIITKGSTDRSVDIKILNTDGTPNESIVFNTSGLALWYRRAGAAKTALTPVTLAALTTAHTDEGFLHIDDGVYRLDLPDAAFATGANHVTVGGTVTGCVVVGGRVKLVDANLEDTVRLGLTALPNIVSGNAGAVVTSGTGTAQLDVTGGKVLLQATQSGVTIPTVTTLTNAPSDSSGVTTLLSRLTNLRALYLENLSNASSGVATSTETAALQAILAKLDTAMQLDGAVYRFTTNALELAPTGSGESAAVIAEAVWDFLIASANEPGSFGELVQSISSGGTAPTTSEIVTALLGDTSIEDGKSLRGILQAFLAVLCGVTGTPGVTRVFRNPADTVDRVTATTPGDGSRTAVTLNVS
jgi:hypothetical protein